jgi:hypothetical protein
VNFPTNIHEFFEFVFAGTLGSILLFGWIASYNKPKTEEQYLREENEKLTRKCKHLSANCRQLQDVNTFLQGEQKRTDRCEKQSQLSQERLNEELVRRDKLIRSLERQIQELRSKERGRR